MAITTSTLAARPELIERVWDMPDQWDEFMDHDPIPGALAPVYCIGDRDVAVYVEPNVWVRHDLL